MQDCFQRGDPENEGFDFEDGPADERAFGRIATNWPCIMWK